MRKRPDPVHTATAIAFGPADNPFVVARRARVSWWRRRSAQSRRLPEQVLAASYIRAWLEGILDVRGSIVSSDLDPAEDELTLVVDFDGRRCRLALGSVLSWQHIVPLDHVTADVLAAVQSAGEVDSEFYLDGYAEESYMRRDRF